MQPNCHPSGWTVPLPRSCTGCDGYGWSMVNNIQQACLMVGHWWLFRVIMMNDEGWWRWYEMMDHGDDESKIIEKFRILDMGWDPLGRCFTRSFWPWPAKVYQYPTMPFQPKDPVVYSTLPGWGFGSAQHLKSRYGSGATRDGESSVQDNELIIDYGLDIVVFVCVDLVQRLEHISHWLFRLCFSYL